jgi:hypothetical protein
LFYYPLAFSLSTLYNLNMEATILRLVLAVYCLAAFAVTVFYLHYRRLTPGEYIFWGILALVLPVFGPFFVISARPGPRKRLRRPRKSDG